MDLFARVKTSAMDQQATLSTTQDTSPSHELNTDAVDSSELRTDVRALLDEMQQRASWGEKEHEAEERRLLQELQACVVDATSRDALEKLPKRMCAYEFKPGDIAWNCRVCQVRTDW
uniref:Uncharacterized protein n=1 Tax=Hyaloperonospora arabidopsidis (strain Emoy2) TaxID=559515 RepID=M4BYY9_HYAAE